MAVAEGAGLGVADGVGLGVADGVGLAEALGDALSLGDADGLGTMTVPEPSTNVPAPPSAVVRVSSELAIAQVVTLPSSFAKIVP